MEIISDVEPFWISREQFNVEMTINFLHGRSFLSEVISLLYIYFLLGNGIPGRVLAAFFFTHSKRFFFEPKMMTVVGEEIRDIKKASVGVASSTYRFYTRFPL